MTIERHKAFRFHTAASLMVAGPSGCGKTVFTTNLLLNTLQLLDQPLKSIHYCYGSWQKWYEPLKTGEVAFHEGIPDSDSLPKWFPQGGLLVLDNLMDKGGNDKHGYLLESESVSQWKIRQDYTTMIGGH